MSGNHAQARTQESDDRDEAAMVWIMDQHGGWVPEQFDKATVVDAYAAGHAAAMTTGVAAGWRAAIHEVEALFDPYMQNLDARHEGTLRSIVGDLLEAVQHLQHPDGMAQRWAYARREDAEEVHAGDEDAWRVVPFTPEGGEA